MRNALGSFLLKNIYLSLPLMRTGNTKSLYLAITLILDATTSLLSLTGNPESKSKSSSGSKPSSAALVFLR